MPVSTHLPAALASPGLWSAVGYAGQALFTSRFLVQWAASEKKRDAVVPVAFWWLSLGGGLALFAYATYRDDHVIMLGQGMGLFVYVRNLMLVSKARRRAEKLQRRSGLTTAPTAAATTTARRVDAPGRAGRG